MEVVKKPERETKRVVWGKREMRKREEANSKERCCQVLRRSS